MACFPAVSRQNNLGTPCCMTYESGWTSSQTSMADTECPEIHMQNVVATFNLGVKNINLSHLACSTEFVEYNPKKFAAATARIRYPRTTALIFASGNMVCTGAKDEIRARLAGWKYVCILRKSGFKVRLCNFRIQNLVASSDIGCLLKLDELATAYGACAGYEPDLFPGLILRLEQPKVVYLCFRSGRIVITGARSRDLIYSSFKDVYSKILCKFVDGSNLTSNSSLYRHECSHRRRIQTSSAAPSCDDTLGTL